jgi:ribA/ribD-fused uncharacterized protein
MDRIEGFCGENRFLSNFAFARVTLDGVVYSTTEHAYQAAKTLDSSKRAMIKIAKTPGVAKRLGKLLELREDWLDVREGIMTDLLIQKFSQPEYMHQLLSTGDAYLEETNTWNDTFWGVCSGKGLNRLGHILMQIRSDLRQIV